MEQEIASIIRYIMKLAGNKVNKVLHKVPVDFTKPTIYFPVPEFKTSLSSMSSYKVSYMWLIKIFARTTEEAYALARDIVSGIANDRFMIPIVNKDGSVSSKAFAVMEPQISFADDGTYTLEIDWDSIRLYNRAEVQKMQTYIVNYFIRRSQDG